MVANALPRADRARVDEEKVDGYLLSDSHPVGRYKARVFRRLGFTAGLFRKELLRLAREGAVVDRSTSEYGTKYVVDGEAKGPTGSIPIRTVWVVEPEADDPRLVTAYPRGTVRR